jgi:hypothetical protein
MLSCYNPFTCKISAHFISTFRTFPILYYTFLTELYEENFLGSAIKDCSLFYQDNLMRQPIHIHFSLIIDKLHEIS